MLDNNYNQLNLLSVVSICTHQPSMKKHIKCQFSGMWGLILDIIEKGVFNLTSMTLQTLLLFKPSWTQIWITKMVKVIFCCRCWVSDLMLTAVKPTQEYSRHKCVDTQQDYQDPHAAGIELEIPTIQCPRENRRRSAVPRKREWTRALGLMTPSSTLH